LIIDDITNVGGLLTILLLPAILSYPPMRIIVSQASIAAGRGCCFTSGLPCLIIRLVTNKGLTSMVSGRWCYCDDVACCLNPLLG
jgi:hypothetical protein